MLQAALHPWGDREEEIALYGEHREAVAVSGLWHTDMRSLQWLESGLGLWECRQVGEYSPSEMYTKTITKMS